MKDTGEVNHDCFYIPVADPENQLGSGGGGGAIYVAEVQKHNLWNVTDIYIYISVCFFVWMDRCMYVSVCMYVCMY